MTAGTRFLRLLVCLWLGLFHISLARVNVLAAPIKLGDRVAMCHYNPTRIASLGLSEPDFKLSAEEEYPCTHIIYGMFVPYHDAGSSWYIPDSDLKIMGDLQKGKRPIKFLLGVALLNEEIELVKTAAVNRVLDFALKYKFDGIELSQTCPSCEFKIDAFESVVTAFGNALKTRGKQQLVLTGTLPGHTPHPGHVNYYTPIGRWLTYIVIDAIRTPESVRRNGIKGLVHPTPFGPDGTVIDVRGTHKTSLDGTGVNGTSFNGTSLNGTSVNATSVNVTQPMSEIELIRSWIKVGIPPKKLVLAIPLYGLGFELTYGKGGSPEYRLLDSPGDSAGLQMGGYMPYYAICLVVKNGMLKVQYGTKNGVAVIATASGQLNPEDMTKLTWVGFEDETTIWYKIKQLDELSRLGIPFGGVKVYDLQWDDYSNGCSRGKFPMTNTILNGLRGEMIQAREFRELFGNHSLGVRLPGISVVLMLMTILAHLMSCFEVYF